MQRSFAYIPTGHRLKMEDLSSHEYFGDDLIKGKATVALFRSARGTLVAVWSYGDWASYGVKFGDVVTFKHDQSFRETEITFCGTINSVNFELVKGDGKKIPQWTLK